MFVGGGGGVCGVCGTNGELVHDRRHRCATQGMDPRVSSGTRSIPSVIAHQAPSSSSLRRSSHAIQDEFSIRVDELAKFANLVLNGTSRALSMHSVRWQLSLGCVSFIQPTRLPWNPSTLNCIAGRAKSGSISRRSTQERASP